MTVFGVSENSRSPFLALKQRRKSASVPYKAFFGEFFAIFGAFFVKKVSFIAKIASNLTVFDPFEKDARVFALNRKIRTYG